MVYREKKQRDNGQSKDNGKVVDRDQKRGGKKEREVEKQRRSGWSICRNKTCWLGKRSEMHQNRVKRQIFSYSSRELSLLLFFFARKNKGRKWFSLGGDKDGNDDKWVLLQLFERYGHEIKQKKKFKMQWAKRSEECLIRRKKKR